MSKMDISSLPMTYTKPTMGQVISLVRKVDRDHKLRLRFEMVTGDPVGYLWCTQHVKTGDLVSFDGKRFVIDSVVIDYDHGPGFLLKPTE